MDRKRTTLADQSVIPSRLAHHAADLLHKIGDKQPILPREAAEAAKKLRQATNEGVIRAPEGDTARE